MKLQHALLSAAAAGIGYLAYDRLRQRPLLDLRGKVVLITGGSRGLGLAMAREFGSHGAIVVICARDRAELDRAHADLSARGIRALASVCDITNREQVQAMIAAASELLGSIDVLVNNAGVIRVGPAEDMGLQDFEQAMNVMFWGALNTTLAVLPGMRAMKQGSIVNITSIGGKVAIPHLLPYSCAKFATVALSEGLRTELAPAGIRVTTVAPGLLRTGSHLHAEFKGETAGEYRWFATGAATPLVSIPADRAARLIVRATRRGESERVLSIPANLLATMHGLFPTLTAQLLDVANRMLPLANGNDTAPLAGHDIESRFNSRLWKAATGSGRRAAVSLNEMASD